MMTQMTRMIFIWFYSRHLSETILNISNQFYKWAIFILIFSNCWWIKYISFGFNDYTYSKNYAIACIIVWLIKNTFIIWESFIFHIFAIFIFMNNIKIIILYFKLTILKYWHFSNGDWGLGIGDWGLGIGDWAQSPIPNPQSPIPIPIFWFF